MDVYYDDITMTYTPTRILQSNEYYPFGLQTAGSWTRDNTANNFLYDAGNELNATSGFYDLAYRNYDAAVGRFFQVDPLSSRDHSLTPYHYAGDNPIASNDPPGLMRQYVPEKEYREPLHNNIDTNGTWGDDYFNNYGGGGGSGGYDPYGDAYLVKTGAMSADEYAQKYSEGRVTSIAYENEDGSFTERAVGVPTVGVYSDDGKTLENVSAYEILGCNCGAQKASYLAAAKAAIDDANAWGGFADFLRNTRQFVTSDNPFYQAEAIYADHGWSFIGQEGDKGGFFVLAGKDKGKFFSYKESTYQALATDLGYGIEIGRVDITGNPEDFNSEYFYGFRQKVYISGGEGGSLGMGLSWSSFDGRDVTATSVQMSVGLSLWFISGGYNAGIIEK